VAPDFRYQNMPQGGQGSPVSVILIPGFVPCDNNQPVAGGQYANLALQSTGSQNLSAPAQGASLNPTGGQLTIGGAASKAAVLEGGAVTTAVN
jgi:hypothetical protein